MPTEVTQLIYKFDELSDEAKEKARDWYREGNLDHDWWEHVYELAETAGGILGIEMDRKRGDRSPSVYFSGFSSQGDGACFEGCYAYAKGWRSALLHEFGPGETLDALLKIGQTLQAIQARQFYKLRAICGHRGHYYHSGCMWVEVSHEDSLYRDIGDAEDGVRDALRGFADWIYRALEREHDWLQSDETVDESIRANGYEFLASGEIA